MVEALIKMFEGLDDSSKAQLIAALGGAAPAAPEPPVKTNQDWQTLLSDSRKVMGLPKDYKKKTLEGLFGKRASLVQAYWTYECEALAFSYAQQGFNGRPAPTEGERWFDFYSTVDEKMADFLRG